MRPPRLPRLALPVVALAGLLVACTGDGPQPAPGPPAFPTPAAAQFADGACSQVAPIVLEVGAAASELGDGPQIDPVVVQRLQRAQDGLVLGTETADPSVQDAVRALVTRIGLVRLAADAERHGPDRTADLREAYLRVLEVCTAGSPAPTRP